MTLRALYETVEDTARPSPSISVDLDRLAAVIRDANRPVAMQTLAREALRAMIVTDGVLRTYVPGRRYEMGERLRLLDGRLGDVVGIAQGQNREQGEFEIITVRMRSGESVRLAAGVAGAPEEASPELVTDETVEMLLLGREPDVVRRVRQALAADPRFITLYYSDGEYGCLREFFPPMSPDVLDAALALILDALFDDMPIPRLTEDVDSIDLDHVSQLPPESLFSTTRLDGALSSTPEWQEPARAIFEMVHSLWLRAEGQAEVWDDVQMARVFLQPLLRALGWSSAPLPELTSVSASTYALCPDDFAASALYTELATDEGLHPWALALLQTVAWGHALDRLSTMHSIGGAPVAEPAASGRAVPIHSLVSSLHQTDVRWGVVTNGRVWRLVSRDANSLLRAYYEVDLGDVFDDLAPGESLDRERWEVFRRWWLLFRQASYVRNSDGRCLLEYLREREPQAERQTRILLRERLLTKALPAVAGGFVAYRCNRLGVVKEPPASLEDIVQASALLLMRMLFVLVAEGRGFLPVVDPDYASHSLTTQAEWSVERVRRDLPLSQGVYTTPRYDIVLALFRRIARGDADKNLPTYGRLFFDPGETPAHRSLERMRLSDASLAQALDALFRGIDYRTLDARDLVSVGAALLGAQLNVIDAEAGDVLITREGDERLRSGTLPDFVVTSVVDQALGPLLDARHERFVAAMDEVISARRRLRRTLDRERRRALHRLWEQAARRARDAFLGIHVCDPAMGAGDFLISAVDVLTDGIIAHLGAYHREHPDVPRDWNPIYRLLDDVAEDIREEMERQGVTTAPQAINDTLMLSRLVAQRALFGVSADAQAVELAKAGLWLHTFAVGAPLSFLDHHLRAGDALMSADLGDVMEAYELSPISATIAEDAEALFALTERVDTTPLDVRWSATQFDRAVEVLQPYRRLLDMALVAELGDTAAGPAIRQVRAPHWREDLERVTSTWAEMHGDVDDYFHWAVEFPEVYMDLAEATWLDDPGFDVVLGAPPWLPVDDTVQADVDDARAAYYARRYLQSSGKTEVSQAYLGLAHRLVRRPTGRTAYVLSREWLASPTGGI